jgi:hypothetical protein
MSPGEKAALEARALAAGRLSMGEYIRRTIVAADDLGTPEEAAELAALLPVFWSTHEETLRRVDATIRKVDDTLEFLRSARHA